MRRDEFPNWSERRDVYLTELHVSSQGMIEEASGMLQVQFKTSSRHQVQQEHYLEVQC